MTDTTAPRTAAPLSASEEAELRQDIIEHDPATAESIYGVDVLQLLATLDRLREAIEPLLALVQAALYEVGTGPTSELDRAVAALPPEIVAAARKA